MKKNNWAIIRSRIKAAELQEVERSKMAAFLKETFSFALDALDELVRQGIDLSERKVVTQLKELELALNQVPQRRVRAFDVSDVLDDFNEYVMRFYVLLSVPRQDAETSFSCRWVVGQIDAAVEEMRNLNDSLYLLDEAMFSTKKYVGEGISPLMEEFGNEREKMEQKKERLGKRLTSNLMSRYFVVCENLSEHGSDTIRAMLADAAENLAHLLTSEDYLDEARFTWDLVITLLSQKDNLRITQRAGRLAIAQQIRKNITNY